MARTTRRRVLMGGIVLAVLAAIAVPVWPALRVSHDGQVLALLPGRHVTVSYVHSIDGLPVEEDLRAQDGRLVVERTRLVQFGAGMGQVVGEGHGRSEGRWWVVDDLDRDVGPELLLRVGAERVDHRLRTSRTELALSRCLPGEQVQVAPVRVPTSALLVQAASTPTDDDCRPHTAQTKDDS